MSSRVKGFNQLIQLFTGTVKAPPIRLMHRFSNNSRVITHLQPDIVECEVMWALGSITTKLVQVMAFQWSYFIRAS